MVYKSGKNSRVVLGSSTPVYCKSWSVDETVEKVDTTSGENQGFASYVAGVKDVAFTIEFNHNYGGSQFVQLSASTSPASDLSFCQDGNTINGTNCLVAKSGGYIVLTNSCKADVRGSVSGTITGILTAGLSGTETTAFTDLTS